MELLDATLTLHEINTLIRARRARKGLDAQATSPPVSPTTPPSAPSTALTLIQQDVVSALKNLRVPRPVAEGAVRRAKDRGIEDDFEVLFRKSMELMRENA